MSDELNICVMKGNFAESLPPLADFEKEEFKRFLVFRL
jgi:hypothetical protein